MPMDEVRLLATIGLGLLAGALFTEAAVLVPYWRSISPQAFSGLHEAVAPRLYSYFAPLTIGAVSFAAASGVIAATSSSQGLDRWLTLSSSALALSLLGFYRLYFESANQKLPDLARLEDPTQLVAELRRWQLVHTVRTGVCLASFVCAVFAH
jgi:Domain of unknown function (DUF1772)